MTGQVSEGERHRSCTARGWIHADADDVGDAMQIDVVCQQGCVVAPCDGGDEAVDEAARSDSFLAALAVDPGGGFKVGGGVDRVQVKPLQQPAQVALAGVGACAGENLHHHRLGHRERPIFGDELGESDINRASGGSVELDPGRGVGQDHAPGCNTGSAGMSSSAWAPRMASASSRVMGCPARWRRARSTASVLVCTP